MKNEIKTKGEINYCKTWMNDHSFFLNHSCDEWIIGDIEEAKKFAQNLLDLIKEVEDKSKPL